MKSLFFRCRFLITIRLCNHELIRHVLHQREKKWPSKYVWEVCKIRSFIQRQLKRADIYFIKAEKYFLFAKFAFRYVNDFTNDSSHTNNSLPTKKQTSVSFLSLAEMGSHFKLCLKQTNMKLLSYLAGSADVFPEVGLTSLHLGQTCHNFRASKSGGSINFM